MIPGFYEVFSDNQALTATAVSTNVLDLKSNRSIGDYEAMCVEFVVNVAADFTTTDETYQFTVQTDDNSGFSSVLNWINRAIVATKLVQGYRFTIPLPTGESEQYIRVNYTLGGTTPSITVSARLVPLESIPSSVRGGVPVSGWSA